MHGLVHKWTELRRCLRCSHFIFVVLSSDETYFGAHYFGIYARKPENKSLWICNECFGDKDDTATPKKKDRMGFKV